VFADVDPETLNLDPVDVRKRLTPRTKAIITAHYAGVACALEGLSDLTHANERVLIEDAAHALGGSYLGRPLGTWGLAGAFSFHGTKNIVAGEGGMMITSDPALASRAEVVREKGTDRSQFLRGVVDKYTWQAVGSSYLMSDLLAALVASQWRRMESLRRARAVRFQRYQEAFAPLAADGSLRLPVIPVQCEPAYHIYFCRVDTASTRGRLMTALRAAGIEASSHFVPLHTSPYATAHLSSRRGDLPVTEEAAETILRLPLYPHLSDGDQATVIDRVLRFFDRATGPGRGSRAWDRKRD
jgi:dTDP-4-amino-4,6-dideoxygalactose transaminase